MIRWKAVAGLLTLAVAGLPNGVCAQTEAWPTRPVRIIAPYAAGGLTDVMARITADRLSALLGQPFVIENRPGAGGAIGTEYAVRQPADGYSLYFGANAQITVLPLVQKVNYDPTALLEPISIVGFNGNICAADPSLPVRNLSEFIAYVRAHPNAVNYGVTGIGTISQLVPASLIARTKIEMLQIPYNGSVAALADLFSGHIQLYCTGTSGLIGYANTNKVTLLGISTEKRLPDHPDLPTFAETFPGFVFLGWNAYFAPVGTPRHVISRMNEALAKIAKEPEVIRRFAELGIDAASTTPAQTSEIIAREKPIYEEAVRAAGLGHR